MSVIGCTTEDICSQRVFPGLTQCMVRPCVARGFVKLASAVLHQCIRSLIGAVLLRTIMDISARAVSLSDRPQMGQLGHQCSHAPGRPILHLFSSSRRPRRVTGKGSGITSSLVLSMLTAIRRVE